MSAAADRHAWAVALMALRPDERVLEVGCGPGVTASCVCAALPDGGYVGVDRSAKMVAAAVRRNASAGGRAAFHATTLMAFDDPEGFGVLFAFHVAAFWREPGPTLTKAAALLEPGGRLWLFNQLPGWNQRTSAQDFARDVADVLARHGFTPDAPILADLSTGLAVAVCARPA